MLRVGVADGEETALTFRPYDERAERVLGENGWEELWGEKMTWKKGDGER